MRRRANSRTRGDPTGTPGLRTARSSDSEGADEMPRRTSAPKERRPSASAWSPGVSASSTARTRASRRRRSAAAARPLAPNPTTNTRLFASSCMVNRGFGSSQFQGAEGDDGAEDAQDVKTHDHLRLVPTFFLEMMMQRRHEKNPPALPGAVPAEFEPGHLDQHGNGLGDEHAAGDHEHQRLVDEHRDDAQHAAQGQGPGVTHEHLRGVTVEPEKSQAGADHGGAKDGESR